MKVIYKYELEITDNQIVNIPSNFEILSVDNQRGELCLWALGDTDVKEGSVNIEIYGTGHLIPEGHRQYIGTVILEQGFLVFHVFKTILP